MKVCTKCKQEKELSEFNKRTKSKDNLSFSCKSCHQKYRNKTKQQYKEYRKRNHKKIKTQKTKYYQENKEEINIRRRKQQKDNPSAKRKWDAKYYQKNKLHIKKIVTLWRNKNRKIYNESTRKYEKERRKNEPIYKLKGLLRTRMYKIFKNIECKKPHQTQQLLGVSFKIAKEHIEKQFVKGMNWNNYGIWHVDHIKPLASAKTPEKLIKLCHYTNLQPLWAKDNLSKKDKIPLVSQI